MVRYERTKDLEAVRAILTDPKVWPHIGDDFAPAVDAWQPQQDPRIWYVAVIERWLTVGLFTFLPRSTVLFEVHLALLPERKTHGREILRGGLTWMMARSTAERIIAEVPACNRLAVQLAAHEMEPYGINPRAFRKHGVLQDLHLFGIGAERCRV